MNTDTPEIRTALGAPRLHDPRSPRCPRARNPLGEPVITIRHTHADGTTVDGSTKGDGVLELLAPFSFTWRRYAGIHIRGSRDTFSWHLRIHAAADALRAAGHTVTVEIDDTWRPAAVRAAERGERVEARVERLEDRADRAEARSAAAAAKARDIADGMPFGEPVKVGHHSEGRHRRDIARIQAGDAKAWDERKYADRLADRAAGSAANEAAKHNPRAIMRRIETLKTQVRTTDRWIAQDEAEGAGPTSFERLHAERARDLEEITYLEGILAEHADAGTFLAWSADTIAKGDRVKVSGHWYPVKKVNRLSVSLDNAGAWPSTAKWDAIHGRRRDDMQLDTPNGDPWPVADAVRVAAWNATARAGRAAEGRYDGDSATVSRLYRWALRIALGLDVDAGDPQVRAYLPDPEDTPRVRELAILCHEVHKQLAAGVTPSSVRSTTVPFATDPAWTFPADLAPTDVRVDQLNPGDLIRGIWDRDSMSPGGRRLLTGVQGPVLAVSEVRNRREGGDWVTVTLEDGDHEHRTHVWVAAYRAGSWEAEGR